MRTEIITGTVSWRVKLARYVVFCITFNAYLFYFQLKIVRELRKDAGRKGIEIA
jgi:hypothetical protein